MVLLQPKLSLKLSQRQILTPGLVQMVCVLALNKLELKDMINAEMVENPVLEELEDSVPLLDEVGTQEEERERAAAATRRKSRHRRRKERSLRRNRFRLVLPGISRSRLSQPQRDGRDRAAVVREFSFQAHQPYRPPGLAAGRACRCVREVREAAELIIGNLNEDGYLIASDDELLGIAPPAAPEVDADDRQENVVKEAAALGLAEVADEPELRRMRLRRIASDGLSLTSESDDR